MLYSLLLVTIQLLAMIYLVLTSLHHPFQIVPVILLIIAGIIGLWGVWVMSKEKFNVLPEVVDGATLVTEGPYKYIRNPMYTGLILAGVAFVIHTPRIDVLLAFLILVTDLLLKIHREEGFLRKSFNDYDKYAKKTKRLIPFIY